MPKKQNSGEDAGANHAESESETASEAETASMGAATGQPLFRLQGSDSALQPRVQSSALRSKGSRAPARERAAAILPAPITVDADDLIEIEIATPDGQSCAVWMRADEYRATVAKRASRGETSADAVLAVPDVLDLAPRRGGTRGVGQWVIKALHVLGVDPAGETAKAIAARLDQQTSDKRPRLGLCHCPLETDGFALGDAPPVAGDAPVLVLLHGTMSSTWGSFGDLWSTERAEELAELRKAYGNRVYAFEHATLAESPIANAVALARALNGLCPGGGRIHLLSHSRGGLIGELLCRGSAAGPLPEAIVKLFGDDKAALDDLRQLEALLAKSKIERFVRVACPALGTTLASGRLDRWLSVVGTACSLLTQSMSTPIGSFFGAIGDFFAAVIKERTDPKTLPGLAAMMPDSPLIALLNFPAAPIAGELTVIAGDVDFTTPWGQVLEWMANRFYASGHDLVVNTPSMSGGVERREPALMSLHRTSKATHFNYFANDDSAKKIARALTRASKDTTGFEPLVKPAQPIARGELRGRPDQQPTVFVLPGIMGSELAVGSDLIWIDGIDLVRGRVADLAIDSCGVVPMNPLRKYYGDLIQHLARSHNVEPFAFDWRLPMEDEADRLADAVRRVLREAKPNKQPIRLLAHSMGGLVARAMIARHAELWREVTSLPQSRLVMLGTPNGGSHAVNELLIGRSETLGLLQKIDITHDTRELLEIICRFPGLLSMLPKDSGEDYFDQKTWQGYRERDAKGEDWVVPEADDLAKAKALRTLLDETPPDPANVVYLAGQAQQTVCGMRMASSGDRIELLATDRGDGRVTWESGIPANVSCWYLAGVEHGDLAREPDGFAAIEDLLATGTTSRLPKTAPVSRSQEETVPVAPQRDTLYPTPDSLAASALGATLRPPRATVTSERQTFNVRMVHGHLSCASHPLMVGHYLGDPLVSAEGELDRELGGALSRRLRLGVYPGKLNEFAIVVPHRDVDNGHPRHGAEKKPDGFKGGLIVGLGEVGALTQGALTETVSRALIEWLLTQCIEPSANGATENDAPAERGVSTLLIGTGTGGLPVTDSLQALLRAVARANRVMTAAGHPARITELEFIELYQDQAIRAVKAIKRIPEDIDDKTRFAFEGDIECKASGLRRPYVEEPAGWWQRLNVSAQDTPDSPGEKTLRFSMTGRRARAEVQLLPTQRRLVDRFVEQSVGTTSTHTRLGRTLFELLFPNELKDQAPDTQDLIMVVDEEAAHYPWELLEDPRDKDERPMVYRRGLLRQLEASRYRSTIQSTPVRTALVIGDPVGPFPELPEAQREAQTVAAILKTSLNHVEPLHRPKAEEVINALFQQSYQILHMAGHGVYKYPLNKLTKTAATWRPLPGEAAEIATGMVIGDHMVLSPKEVHQMRDVPELVFINCCHLGQIKPEQTQPEKSPLIAANLATEFIAMGVRAVIAAGWAVDDAAANTFAREFYKAMLSGEYFGAAVAKARRTTFDLHPNVNTWGAYQCYGDPQYRLLRDLESDSDATSRSAAAERRFDSFEEVIAALNAIAARLQRGKNGASGDAITRIVDAIKKSHADWLERGDVLAALARAWKAAGDSKAATSYFRLALATKSETLTLGDIQIGLQLTTEGNAPSLDDALRDFVKKTLQGEPSTS